MEKGFSKGDSRNLPKVDVDMVRCFFIENSDFSSVEIRGKKLTRSTRESYGDNAVGFVQLKRENQICIVKSRITPEHKTREKGYQVEIRVDEENEVVLMCKCHDCAASEGGCKHAVAFLSWLHRRSEEPSVTDVTCYWKKSKMAINSSSTDIIRARDMGSTPNVQSFDETNLLSSFLASVSGSNCEASVLRYFEDKQQPLSIHRMCSKGMPDTPQLFLQLMAKEMTEESIQAVFNATKEQSEAPVWFELRYARVTGSVLYEAAHCQTTDGSLIRKIMGERSAFISEAMIRGKSLEKKVIQVLESKMNLKVTNSGLVLSQDFPVLGATPDGITSEYVIEIKCPSSEKTFKTYVKNGELNKKCWAQIQSQMYFCKRKMGLFCVAHPDFESTNNADIYKVTYDEKIVAILKNATVFWSDVVFPKLKKIYF